MTCNYCRCQIALSSPHALLFGFVFCDQICADEWYAEIQEEKESTD